MTAMADSPIRLTRTNLYVGLVLPWAVYDQNGRLLLNKGSVIGSDRQRDALLARGIYRLEQGPAEPAAADRAEVDPLSENAFDRLDGFVTALRGLFRRLERAEPGLQPRVHDIARNLRCLYRERPDAMIAAVHLMHEFEYSTIHPLHTAIVANAIAEGLKYKEHMVISLTAAALTANVSVRGLQDLLQTQMTPLTDEQRGRLRAHPAQSARMLSTSGVTDRLCLDTVLQHHECGNGEGYPQGLRDDAIRESAQILNLADRYCALISARSYRAALPYRHALKRCYDDRGIGMPQRLTVNLIRGLGVHPPGAFVHLSTGEEGLVAIRGDDPLRPKVAVFITDEGQRRHRIFVRDCAADGARIDRPAEPIATTSSEFRAIWDEGS